VLAVVDAEDLEGALAHHVALAGEAFAFAFGIGPLVHATLGWFRIPANPSSGNAQP
jgi:hypothetical protein